MAAILAWLEGSVIKFALDWLWGKISAAISKAEKVQADHKAAVDQAAQDSKKAEELPSDATAAQTDDAIDDELKHF